MKKALFILMLVVVGVFVGVLLSPPRPSAWQPGTQFRFVGFVDSTTIPPVTNTWRVVPSGLSDLAKAPPAMYALFEVKNSPAGETVWHVNEVSQQEGGKWHPSVPGFIQFVHDGIRQKAAVAVPTTNAPLRVVIELEQFDMKRIKPPDGKVARFFWNLRGRWKQLRHPNDPKEWQPRGALFRITNEFNFAEAANSAAGK